MDYKEILDTVVERMGEATKTPLTISPYERAQPTIEYILNRIGLETERQGGAR